MMDWYASERRYGDVVSLLSDMVKAGRNPNLNTYRIMLNACQRCDQAQLAFEIYAVMKSKKMEILQEVGFQGGLMYERAWVLLPGCCMAC